VTAALTVPQPTLVFDDAGGGAAALEKPVTIQLAAVTEAAVPVTPAALTTFGYSVQRRTAPGALPEVWDDASKAWVPDQPSGHPKPVALAYKDGDPHPWQGLLVAAGARDASGGPAFAKAANGYPVYRVRAAFAGKDGATGMSPQSASITFASASDRNLLVVGPGDGEQLDQATQGRVLLKNPGLQVIGGLTVTRDTPGATVRLDNAAGAGVVLHADGSIELIPAAGKGVLVSGDLETDHIRYLPAGGGLKRDLT
jgi:hypothetical protein